MPDDSPFAYEEVFSLILSLTQQVLEDREIGAKRQETIENYFIRLTKWALGEYEFSRRMGFEGIKVVRIAPYEALWKYYGQRKPEDFIFQHNEQRCCVDVKYYDSFQMLERIEIQKHFVNSVREFQQDFHLDRAFLAIKRFERWYLLDADKIAKLPVQHDRHLIEIEWARNNHEILDERHVCFNLGKFLTGGKTTMVWYDRKGTSFSMTPADDDTINGVFYETLKLDEMNKKARFDFTVDMTSTKTQPIEKTGVEYSILLNLFRRTEENLRSVLLREALKNRLSNVTGFEDLCPTVFTICDELPELRSDGTSTCKDLAFLKGLRSLEGAKYVFVGPPERVRYQLAKLFTIDVEKLRAH